MNKSYEPPVIWQWPEHLRGGLNRPVSGATHEKTLPQGKHPLQLYSMATPNGVKVTVMLEELLELGHEGAQYDAWPIDISQGDQFGSGFVALNPNSKIPVLLDGSQPIFESGAILLHLAEKFSALLPNNKADRTACLSWLFWQVGSAPFLAGGFGHFYAYAPEKLEYPINRYAMEAKRQLHVLNQHLAQHAYMAGEEYSIADIAIWPWYGCLVLGQLYNAAEFLQVQEYEHVLRWARDIAQRPAVQRGQRVNRFWGEESTQLPERHDARDFD